MLDADFFKLDTDACPDFFKRFFNSKFKSVGKRPIAPDLDLSMPFLSGIGRPMVGSCRGSDRFGRDDDDDVAIVVDVVAVAVVVVDDACSDGAGVEVAVSVVGGGASAFASEIVSVEYNKINVKIYKNMRYLQN